jgi:carboxymethylenebutenolidase
MKTQLSLAIAFIGIVVIGNALYRAARPARGEAGSTRAAAPVLPSEAAAKAVLNSTRHHREWVSVPAGSSNVRAFVVYPERSDKAPAVVLTAGKQGASDWIRAVADHAAGQGFIAVVPDVLSGLGPYGGDSNAFANKAAIAAALDRMGHDEIVRRTNAVRDYTIALPAANGKSASVDFDLDGALDVRVAGGGSSKFKPAIEAWPLAVAFLIEQTGDKPIYGNNPNVPEGHSAHFGMAMAQTPGGGRGYPQGKPADLPAGIFNAHSVLTNSKSRKEFVDIPMGNMKLHTWVEYPEGDAKAPIAIVMQHGPGMDDWQRALADQLAQQGFIAIAVDLHSGLGPGGGNYDSFQGTDEVMRATARLTPDDMLNRYKAARDWGMKVPRANGKSASIGFCMGGGNSFRFAAQIPELNAAVVFYGSPANQEMLANIKAPVLAFYGDDDARVTATMPPVEASMKKYGKSFEAHSYPHATHGFLEYQDLAGNPAATSDSWSRTIAFLKEHTR